MGGMFHDMGLKQRYSNSQNRFEVDSANATAEFPRERGIAEMDVELVWDGYAGEHVALLLTD
jgi:hypothetical protein